MDSNQEGRQVIGAGVCIDISLVVQMQFI